MQGIFIYKCLKFLFHFDLILHSMEKFKWATNDHENSFWWCAQCPSISTKFCVLLFSKHFSALLFYQMWLTIFKEEKCLIQSQNITKWVSNDNIVHCTKNEVMKFSIKDFFSKCDQIRSSLRIWSRLLKKSLMENFIFVQWYTFHAKSSNWKPFWQIFIITAFM